MIRPSDITAVIDTREQLPYTLAPLSSTVKKLETGDYSLLGFEDEVCVERKSLPDYLSTISKGRDRWEDQIERMLLFPTRLVVIEASWADLYSDIWRSQMHPNAVVGSTMSFMARGIPILMAGSREQGQITVARFLWFMANKYNRRS